VLRAVHYHQFKKPGGVGVRGNSKRSSKMAIAAGRFNLDVVFC